MLQFKANLKVIGKLDRIVTINETFQYSVCKVSVAGLELAALFDIRVEVNEGDCIVADSVYLTKIDAITDISELALRVDRFTTVPEEEFVPMEHLDVKVEGMLITSKKCVLKEVGVTRKPFITSTLSVRNEEGEYFYVFLVAFHKQAELINEARTSMLINLDARLKKRTKDDGFELNVTSFSPRNQKED